MDPFLFGGNATTTVATINGSARSSAAIYDGGGPVQVLVSNEGTATVFINFGDDTVTAATTNTPVLAGTVQVFTVENPGKSAIWAAVRAAGATGNVYFTPGRGL